MWGFVVVMLAWGSWGALAESSNSVMGRLSWCNTLCMCETRTEVQCFEEDDVYQLLGFNAHKIRRLKNVNWTLQTNVFWCTDLCLCNNKTGKEFHCTAPETLTQLIINKIGDTYFLPAEGESEIKQEAERSVDEDEDPSLDQDMGPRKGSDRRRNKKNRKQKKNQRRKHKIHNVDSQPEPEPEPESEPEPQHDPEGDIYTPTVFLTTSQPVNTSSPTPEHFSHQHEQRYIYGEEEVEEVESIEEHEPLPKQEAVAASPAVTALQPPIRKTLPYSTAESYTPQAAARDTEGLSPRVQPIVEVPKEKKTMASMVSQDLDDLGSTVRNIKNDVMLNQRILLVTVAIAGVAMLGVLILAILSCTNRRHNQAANAAKNRDSKEGNHNPKINLEEAW